MHELALTQEILSIVAQAAAGRRVLKVTLEIGALAGVMADAIAFSFEVLAPGTELEIAPLGGAELNVKSIEIEDPEEA